MPSGSDAVLDPEAARPPPRAGRTCRLQTWALSAALLLLAAACAAFAVRSCWVPAGRASPGASPAPSSRLPDDPELLPNDRLPDPLQVRCSPTRAPGETPARLWDPFSVPHSGPTPSATREDSLSLPDP